jgi:hypothetical protein
LTRPDILLIEYLDSAGASADDARARLAALDACGVSSRVLVVAPETHGGPGLADRGRPMRAIRVADESDCAAALGEAYGRHPPALVLVAASSPGGGPLAGRLPAGSSARWWPAGVPGGEPGAAPGRPARPRGGALEPLVPEPLELGVIDPPRGGRRRLPLWDGDYLLAPAPLGGRAGHELLEAYAEMGEDACALDLVVLADPQPEFERAARSRGVGTRVHFAGPAPRGALAAWLGSAVATVLATDRPVAAGLVLHSLEGGAPVLSVGSGAGPSSTRSWLAARRLAGGTLAAGKAGLVAALDGMYERGPALRAAIERGRAEAERHFPRAIAPSLGAALERLPELRRRAA